MIARFCAYCTLRNLRFFEPFLVLFLLNDVGLTYLEIGALLAYEKVVSGALEVPLGVLTDRWGRRTALLLSFGLAAVAFVAFGVAAGAGTWTVPLLYFAQTLYAVAEAARSGTHKGIMLDWLSEQGRQAEKTAVLGVTRFFSKTSEGASALIAGLIVWQTGHFAPLFWVATIPAVLAVGLIWTYPPGSEGTMRRAPEERGRWLQDLKDAARRPGLLGILVVSVLFESQIKLAMVYLQPVLADTLAGVSLDVAAGIGAVAYGGWFFVQGLAAGSASLFSTRLLDWAGDELAALRWVHLVASVILLATGLVALFFDGAVALVALLGFLLLAALQNVRRPIFITALDTVMDARYRTTTISVETQARSWGYAVAAVAAGALADAGGPGLAVVGMGVALAAAVLWAIVRRARAGRAG